MPKYTIASAFNRVTLEQDARRVPTQSPSQGAPGNINGRTEHIKKVYMNLKRNGFLPNDNYAQITEQLATMLCYSGLNITVDPISYSAPYKTYFEEQKLPYNKADEKNQMSKKNNADDMYPEKTDPFYEMDEQLPQYIKKANEQDKKTMIDYRSLIGIMASIGAVNDAPSVQDTLKIKQLTNNGTKARQ